MYRSQDNETLDELRAENAELKEKLSNRKRLRFEGFLNHVKRWAPEVLIAVVFFSALFLLGYHIYSCESEAHDKAKRWRDVREPAGFVDCNADAWCRVYFEGRPPIRLNCSFDEGCMMISSVEK